MYYSYILSVLNSSHVAFSGNNSGSRISVCSVCIQTGWIKFYSVQKQCVCVCVYTECVSTLGWCTAHMHTDDIVYR